jgi:competence protein ComEC
VLSPELAINSSGFLNRYRHPHPIVVARYKTLGIDLIDTQNQGQIQLRFDETGNVERQYRRGSKVFYWEQ